MPEVITANQYFYFQMTQPLKDFGPQQNYLLIQLGYSNSKDLLTSEKFILQSLKQGLNIYIFKMLSNNQTSLIRKIIEKKKGLLQATEEEFLNLFRQAISLINAVTYLSELIESQTQQLQQRIASLYLILASFFQTSAESHPLSINILEISSKTSCSFERVMIYEILVKKNKAKYATMLIEDISQLLKKDSSLREEEKQIKSLRQRVHEKYKYNQICFPSRVISDVPDFLRLVPEFIPISVSELNWLSPGIISDVEWDNSAQIDKKLEKSRKIFENSLKRSLENAQRTELMNNIENDPYCALHLGFNVKDLQELLIYNSYIAASLVIKISKYPMFPQFLEHLLALPTSASLLDVMARIIRQVRVPQQYVEMFCSQHMNKIIKVKQNGQNYKGLAYTMSAFINCMLENEIINFDRISGDLKCFINQFSNIIDFGPMKSLGQERNDIR